MDKADLMIAGGTEAAICRIGIAGFCALRALSTKFNNNPEMPQDHLMKIEMVLLWEMEQGY